MRGRMPAGIGLAPTVDAAGAPARECLRAVGVAALALVFGMAAGTAEAQLSASARAGQQKSQACMVCHGPIGVSSAPDAPNLAGQPQVYLTAQLRAYRSGGRRHEVMNVIARPLSDQDIDDLAAWYSAIRIEAVPPN
jgi:cytochrome c553